MILILYNRTMSEHEMLKEICDTIGYKSKYDYDYSSDWEINWFFDIFDRVNRLVDVREIIFTQEFMDKFFLYRRQAFNIDLNRNVKADMFDHLDDPVSYLYNLLGLWEK